MFGLIALACFDVAGVAFMLYVLVNFHCELKRGRDGSRDLQPTRVAGRNKTLQFNSIPTVNYSAYPESTALERTFIGARPGVLHVHPEVVLRRTSR